MAGPRGRAPRGNQNARRGTAWRDAIRKALRQDPEVLDRLARALIQKALEGDLDALKEIGNRLDGKPLQAHEHDGPGGEPIPSEIRMVIVGPTER